MRCLVCRGETPYVIPLAFYEDCKGSEEAEKIGKKLQDWLRTPIGEKSISLNLD